MARYTQCGGQVGKERAPHYTKSIRGGVREGAQEDEASCARVYWEILKVAY